MKTSSIFGGLAGGASIILWLVLVFFNPYSSTLEVGTLLIVFVMVVLPACLAIVSSFMLKNSVMFIAFLWSFPVSLYLAMTPGIFAFFGVTSACYMVSFIVNFAIKKRVSSQN